MPKVSDIYASPWLRAEDLQGRAVNVIISRVTVEAIRNRDNTTEPKIVIDFEGKAKRLILNKTQARTLCAALGDEANDWTGARISLKEGRAPNGKPTIVITLTPPTQPVAQAPTQAPTEPAAPTAPVA